MPVFSKLNEQSAPQEFIDRFDYDPNDGSFFDRHTGKSLRSNTSSKTYAVIRRVMNGQLHAIAAHRLAWRISYGVWPSFLIDHINGDPRDNRIANLRECDVSQNAMNQKARETKTGVKGVNIYFNKYQVRLKYKGRRIYVGAFKTLEDAAQAYEEAARKYYGEFARTR
jgi:hypothetical protein